MSPDQPFSLGEGSSAEQLEGIVLRLEALDADAAAIAAEKRAVRKAAKDGGFDLPALKRLINRRKLSPEEVIEGDKWLETYEAALGCGAAAVGVLSTSRNADGSFEVKMVSGPGPAEERLTKAAKSRRDAVAMAELARMARNDGSGVR